MPAPWRGYYINLDTSPERRTAVEGTIARAGLGGLYQRFSAATGAEKPADCRLSPGGYGCFRSHHDLLTGLTPDARFVHVLEDDAILAAPFGPAMQSVIDGGLMESFDIVFTETMVIERTAAHPHAEGAFRPQCRAGAAAVAFADRPGDDQFRRNDLLFRQSAFARPRGGMPRARACRRPGAADRSASIARRRRPGG